MKSTDPIAEIVRKLPQKPGVYQFLNHSGDIIYVGKAKNLRKRVVSYFTHSTTHSYKHTALVNKIVDIRYIIVENESDALLLENNFIKENQPRYNILLKDDKTYPWICIRNERFPRVMSTRNYLMDGSEYFGPYTSGLMVKTLLELIRQLYKIRTCSLLLSEENIVKRKYKKCLEFQLGNCKAPCEALQLEEDYMQSIAQIKEILKGNLHHVIRQLHQMMVDYAREMQFEEAEMVRNKMVILEKFKGKSTIVNPRIRHVDVFSMIDEEDSAYVNFLKVVNGAIVQAHNVEVVKRFEEEKEDVLGTVIFDLRKRFNSTATEIIVPFEPTMRTAHVHFTIPLQGDKLKLLELSLRNVGSYKADILQSKVNETKTGREENLLLQLQKDLRMKRLPLHIECFDNSNIQGTDPVASCVVFKSGKPCKSMYRHFNVKSVQGPNDFASMEEIVLRRYKRVMEEKGEIPDLIIVDGGKGQLHAAVKSLQIMDLYGKVSVIGIAKRLEEIYMPGDPVPLYINKNSISLRYIQQIRDEAHRFGISFHRNKRSKSQIQSAFDHIPGIGEKARDKILRSESDMERLKKLSLDELVNLIGKREGRILYQYFGRTDR